MKGKKLVFAVILALIVCLVLIPVSAYADDDNPPAATTEGGGNPVVLSDPATGGDTDVPQPPTAEAEAEMKTVEVGTLDELEKNVENVAVDTVVNVTANITVPDDSSTPNDLDPITVSATTDDVTIVIDLNDNTLTAGTPSIHEANVFEFTKGNITVRNGTINGNIRVEGTAKVYLDPTLTLNGFVYLKAAEKTNPSDTSDPKLNVDCTISNDNGQYAVSTNGRYSGGKITISDNADISCANSIGIYLPSGNLTVEGGSISGTYGIAMLGGNLTLNGGTISASDDAILLEYNKAYGTIDNVVVNGGTVTSENGKTINAYISNNGSANNQAAGDNVSATGGIYSDDSALDYVDKDNTVIAKSNGKYAVGDSVLDVVKPGETVELVNLPEEYNNGTIDLPAGVTIVNGTDKDITMNGITLKSGESYTVPAVEFTYTEAYSKYYVIDGMNAEWTKGSADGLTFKLNSEDVIKVLIDGVEVEFTVENGEIVISAEVLEALEAGEHEIEFVFADGSCKTEITVK